VVRSWAESLGRLVMASDTVTLALDGTVSLESFALAVRNFTELVGALSSEVGHAKIKWTVDDLQFGSTVATVRGEAEEVEAVERVVVAYAAVGRALKHAKPIPYSPTVVRSAEAIASLLNGAIPSIRFETSDEEVTIYSPSDDSGSLVPSPTGAYGVVEGRIETVTRRKGLRFTLYDTLDDKAVSCYLEDGQEELMRGAWGRRALVEGWVSRDPAIGRPLTVRRVRHVELLPDVESGGYRRARGVVPVGSGGLSASETIRRARDAE